MFNFNVLIIGYGAEFIHVVTEKYPDKDRAADS